jgi:hypothetical protein
MGYEISNLPNLLETLDTANLYRALKHETQPPSLVTVLDDMHIDWWNLHNAVSIIYCFIQISKNVLPHFSFFSMSTNANYYRATTLHTRSKPSLPLQFKAVLASTREALCNGSRESERQWRDWRRMSMKTVRDGN